MSILYPLHVLVPTPGPDYPNPTTSLSHPDLPQPSLAKNSTATPLSSIDVKHEHSPGMNHVQGKRGSAVRQSGPNSLGGRGEGRGQEIVSTPIGLLPPSPPLTDNEGREGEMGVTPQELSPALRSLPQLAFIHG